MQHVSKLVVAALAAGTVGATATAFAHPGDRAGGGRQGAADCPMHNAAATQRGEHRMGEGGRGKMEHRGMGQGMRHGQTQDPPQAEEEHRH